MSPLFTGPSSLRHPRERLAFLGVLLWAIPLVPIIGFFVHEEIGLAQIALFIVIAMLYVTLARGRLIGSSVMIHETQHARIFGIVKRTCAALRIPMPMVFVREDYHIPAVALGFGEPYSLVLSSHFIEQYEDDELAFVIGRQLGHIAAGHTRLLSILSVNGNENFLVALVFGPWLRVCELTCDKVGLLVCGSLDAAARAIAVSMFHHFGRKVNMEQFADQGREIANDSILRWGEWLGAEPYGTRRIAEMRDFSKSEQYRALEEWFVNETHEEPPAALPLAGAARVERSDCAGWWRRAIAYGIDFVVITSLVGIFHVSHGLERAGAAPHASASPAPVASARPLPTASPEPSEKIGWFELREGGITVRRDSPLGLTIDAVAAQSEGTLGFVITALYYALLVGFAGQTFGMMITGLRVVTVDFRRPTIWQSLLRYTIGFVLFVPVVILSFFYHRILLHDRWSKTRLITAERGMARASAPLAIAQT